MKITQSYSAYQRTPTVEDSSSYLQNVEFIFGQGEGHGCLFICLFLFFPQGLSYRPSGPRIS